MPKHAAHATLERERTRSRIGDDVGPVPPAALEECLGVLPLADDDFEMLDIVGVSSADELGLTDADFDRIEETYPWVKDVVPVRVLQQEVRFGERAINPRVLATTDTYQEVTGREVLEGRFLTNLDVETVANVCVLGYEIARYLFPFKSPLNERIKIGADYFTVVGVMLPRVPIGEANQAAPGEEVTGEVILPMTTGRKWFGDMQVKIRAGSRDMEQVDLHEIIVGVDRSENVPAAAAAHEARRGVGSLEGPALRAARLPAGPPRSPRRRPP